MPDLLDNFLKKRPGVVALITVIIIGVIILSVGLAAAFIGTTEVIVSGLSDREYATRMLASACTEEALYRLKLNAAYAGGTVPIGSDTCVIGVAGAGSSRTLSISTTSGVYTKTATVVASLKQNTAANAKAWNIDAWTEGDPP